MKTFSQNNIESITLVANKLQELCKDVVFVGGSIMGLLITDSAAPDVRFTVDVDCIINIITVPHYYQFSAMLRKKGFKELSTGDHPICRWLCEGIYVDIVPTQKNILGFSNMWYPEATLHAIERKIDNIRINHISGSYFLATKLEAFNDRGKNDFLSSHDLEDIISLFDGRPEIIADVSGASRHLKKYLSRELSILIDNDLFSQALPGHLNYSNNIHNRTEIVLERIHDIIEIGK